MNIRGINMRKLEEAARRMGVSRVELERALRQNKSAVARVAGTYVSGGEK